MIRAAIDSNILVYAELEPETDKGNRAHRLIATCAPRGILAIQSLLEFVAVIRRKRPASLKSALAKAQTWVAVFEIAPTSQRIATNAFGLVEAHQFQVWDAVIWSAVNEAGASIFFCEDLQDGFAKDGMRAVDPFRLDEAQLHSLLGA
jgi:predicted nucleic acid-binding protein